MPIHVPDEHADTIATLLRWAAGQPRYLTTESKLMDVRRIWTTNARLGMYVIADMPHIHIPASQHQPLFDLVHDSIIHMAGLKTYHKLIEPHRLPQMRGNFHARYAK